MMGAVSWYFTTTVHLKSGRIKEVTFGGSDLVRGRLLYNGFFPECSDRIELLFGFRLVTYMYIQCLCFILPGYGWSLK